MEVGGEKKKKKVCVWGCEGLICEIRLKLENKKIRDSEVSHAIEEWFQKMKMEEALAAVTTSWLSLWFQGTQAWLSPVKTHVCNAFQI